MGFTVKTALLILRIMMDYNEKRIKDEFRIVWDFYPTLLPHPSTLFPGTELLVKERERTRVFLEMADNTEFFSHPIK